MLDKLCQCGEKVVVVDPVVTGPLEETLELEYANELEYYTLPVVQYSPTLWLIKSPTLLLGELTHVDECNCPKPEVGWRD